MKILFFQTLKYKIMEWIYIGGAACGAVLVLGLLVSCSVVRTDFSNKPTKNAMVYYYLPESVLKIKATAKVEFTISTNPAEQTAPRVLEQSFTVTTETVADTRDLLTLSYTSNGMASDDIQYVVNSKGLLETVQVITEDRTPAIVESAATAFATSVGVPVGVPRSSSEKIEIKPYEAEFTVKVSDLSQAITWRQHDFGIEADLDFSISSPDIPDTISLSNLINGSDLKSNDTEIKGILTRPLKNIKLNFEPKNLKAKALPPFFYVTIVDKSKLIVIPVKRSAFVKRVNKIAMQDGLILSNAITNPSSVEGFLSIPINIAKAMVSIPAQLIQFRYDNNTNRLEEQKKLEYEKTILSKKLELEKVKNELEGLKKGK